MDIELEKLKVITNQLLDHLRDDLKIEKIDLDEDYYWNVPTSDLYDPRSKPSELDLGQLSDDWEFLLKTLDDKDQAVSLMLTHLAPLLRYIGEKVGE